MTGQTWVLKQTRDGRFFERFQEEVGVHVVVTAEFDDEAEDFNSQADANAFARKNGLRGFVAHEAAVNEEES